MDVAVATISYSGGSKLKTFGMIQKRLRWMCKISSLLLMELENCISLMDKEAIIVGYGARKISDHWFSLKY